MRLLLAAACCCCCCCLLERVAQPWPLKGGVKPRQGKPSSVKIQSKVSFPFKLLRKKAYLSKKMDSPLESASKLI